MLPLILRMAVALAVGREPAHHVCAHHQSRWQQQLVPELRQVHRPVQAQQEGNAPQAHNDHYRGGIKKHRMKWMNRSELSRKRRNARANLR